MSIRYVALTLLLASSVAQASNLELALANGNSYLVDTADELYAPILMEIARVRSDQSVATMQLFGSAAIDYTPPQSSAIFNILDLGKTFPVVIGSAKGTNLAVAGREGAGRFMAWGSNLPEKIQAGSLPATLNPLVDGSLAYVMKTQVAYLPSARKVALAFLSGGDLTRTQQWLQARYPQWQQVSCNAPATFGECSAGAGLVISGYSVADGDAAAAAAALGTVARGGAGLLYFHNGWSTNAFSGRVAQYMGMEMPYAGNYFNLDAAKWINRTAMLAPDNPLKQMSRLAGHLKNHDFPAFDWTQCSSSVGTVSCTDPAITQEFGAAASYIRNTLKKYDQGGGSLFRMQGNRLPKLWVLLGDKLRQGIRYPLDKQDGGEAFFKAYLADFLVQYNRQISPRQEDTGTFSAALPTNLPRVTTELAVDLPAVAGGRSTGYYALPGVPVTVTRLDGGTGSVGFYLNSIRSGSTREWNTNGLARPKFLGSPVFPAKASPITVTSPYGGPLFLSLPAGAGQVRLKLAGVVTYPWLNGLGSPGEINNFQTSLSNTPFTWAGIRTDFVEVNSRVSKLRETINAAPYNGNLAMALADVWTYMIKGTYDLAGFNGAGLALPTGVANRCTALGWDCTSPVIHARPAVQHITVDTMANCGSGCSGNPYDQDWALTPIGWGETHEIGHNLQRGRLKIFSGRSSEVSNNIFPSYKGWQYFQATGVKVDHCTRGNDAKLYTWLQNAHASGTPSASMYSQLWSQTGIYDNAGERLAFYLQLAYAANSQPGLGSGWEIFTLMYLHERLFTDAIKTTTGWSNNRLALGFGNYATAPTAIDGNDFMLISYSFLTGKDQRAFFDAWGVSYSAEAAQQVASYGFPAAPRVYYAASEHCSSLNAAIYPVDGVTAMP